MLEAFVVVVAVVAVVVVVAAVVVVSDAEAVPYKKGYDCYINISNCLLFRGKTRNNF